MTRPTTNATAQQQAGCSLILHADDFGETAEITAGICQAIEAGVVTSTTIMANMPGTEDALPRARALDLSMRGQASFGVHLNFCEGRPLTNGATLHNERGTFPSKRAMFLRAVRGQLSSTELEAEITAQIARVHDSNVRISHVDGHKHLHQLPVIRGAVARVLPRFGIERVRVTRLTRLMGAKPATLVREALAWQAQRTFRRASLRSPARIVDLQTLMQPPRVQPQSNGTTFSQWAPEGPIEIFCHPGTKLADQEKPGSCRRAEELEYLLSPPISSTCSPQTARVWCRIGMSSLMRILKIVPQAFYSTRGTPLSAYHRARELVARGSPGRHPDLRDWRTAARSGREGDRSKGPHFSRYLPPGPSRLRDLVRPAAVRESAVPDGAYSLRPDLRA